MNIEKKYNFFIIHAFEFLTVFFYKYKKLKLIGDKLQ